jgi:hypothetical protein
MCSNKQIALWFKLIISVVWIIVLLYIHLLSLSNGGGDNVIIAGFLYSIWTVPFGIIWWFYIYNYVITLSQDKYIVPIGIIVTDIVAFIFWFIVFPKLYIKLKVYLSVIKIKWSIIFILISIFIILIIYIMCGGHFV